MTSLWSIKSSYNLDPALALRLIRVVKLIWENRGRISNDCTFVCFRRLGIYLLSRMLAQEQSSMILSVKNILDGGRVASFRIARFDLISNQSITITMEILLGPFKAWGIWPVCTTRSRTLMDDHQTATLARLKLSFTRTEHDGCGAL